MATLAVGGFVGRRETHETHLRLPLAKPRAPHHLIPAGAQVPPKVRYRYRHN